MARPQDFATYTPPLASDGTRLAFAVVAIVLVAIAVISRFWLDATSVPFWPLIGGAAVLLASGFASVLQWLYRSACHVLATFLEFFQPLVRTVFAVLSMLFFITAFFVPDTPYAPFWGMIAVSLICAAIVAGYESLIIFLATR